MWLEHIDAFAYLFEEGGMIGLPHDKYDRILYMPKAVELLREYYGASSDNSLIPRIDHYLSKLGEDPDVLFEFIKHLSNDEKDALVDFPHYKRAVLILDLAMRCTPVVAAHQPHVGIPPASAKASSAHTIQENSINIRILGEKFLKEYEMEYRRDKKTDVPKSSMMENQRAISVFLSIVGDISSSEITKDHIKSYGNISYSLPARLNSIKGFGGMTNEEILRNHWRKVVEGDYSQYPKKNNGTLKKEFGTVKQFLRWLKKEAYINQELWEFIPNVSTSHSKNDRELLTQEDYRLFFNSSYYIQGKHKKPSDYWIPLIGIFTGCRVEEIASLFKEDIFKDSETDLWMIDINENLDIKKRRKTKAAIRRIPIHTQLIELGLLGYVNSLSMKSQLFPDLKANNDGRFSKKWVDKFNRHYPAKTKGDLIEKKDGSVVMVMGLLTQCGIEKIVKHPDGRKTSKSFHSFRHYFINEIDRMSGGDDRIKNFIVGQSYSGERVSNYIHVGRDDQFAMQKLIERINYPTVDFSKIRKIEHW